MIVLWRGLQRLHDIIATTWQISTEASKVVGNAWSRLPQSTGFATGYRHAAGVQLE